MEGKNGDGREEDERVTQAKVGANPNADASAAESATSVNADADAA